MRRDRVVLVGCDRNMEDLVQLVVEQLGEVDVEQVCSTDDAVKLVREHRPSVVIVDNDAPPGKGLEVVQRIKHERGLAGVAVIALCTTHDEGHYLAAQGVADYVTKPLDVNELVDKVQGWAGRSRNFGPKAG